MNERLEFLVIGYGNTLRRDDGVGVKVAEAVAALNLPGVRVITRHQLVPELAEPLARARAAIFVDASVVPGARELELRDVVARQGGQILAHAADPRSLLSLAGQIFGHCPPAWSLAIPVADFGFGDGLSPQAESGLAAAVQRITQLANRMLA
jgi:hydrogenase maturation protease